MGLSWADEDKDFFKPRDDPKEKSPSGRAEMLRPIPKKFAILEAADEAKRQVTLRLEGDKEPTTWPLNPDAELKVFCWWARLRDFLPGDRVWVWLDVDRKRQPKSILMMCDEVTQQEMNDRPLTLTALDPTAQTVTLKPHKAEVKTRKLCDTLRLVQDGDVCRVISNKQSTPSGDTPRAETLKAGAKVFIRTRGEEVSALLDGAALESLRNSQRQRLRQEWIHNGLPGTVTFLHPLSGEMEVVLDHEAIRWGRWLKLGDKVRFKGSDGLFAAVKEARPWRERTQLRLVMDGFAQHDLTLGQRIALLILTPPSDVDTAEYPPDIDRSRSKPERVEWFLASTYCSCQVGGNGCTGMFYTLASCNTHACGMPNAVRAKVGDLIDKGMTDKQIWDELKKSGGQAMLRPHLVP
jgi:hypothetical protein